MCEIFHVGVLGLHGAGKTHFINALTIGDGFTIFPTQSFYEETLKLDETREIHLVECATPKLLQHRPEHFCALLWILDARGSYEDFQASRNAILPTLNSFGRVGILYNVRAEATGTFRERNHWLQLECFAQQLFVMDLDFGETGWEEKVWRLLRFFTGENGG